MENHTNYTFTESAIKASSRPISKNKNGKICILNNSEKSKQVQAGEEWECEIIKDEPRSILIRPIKMTLTKEQNKAIFNSKAQELAEMFKNR